MAGPCGDLIRCEETAGAVKIVDGRVDYILRVKVTSEAQPVVVGLIEAQGKEVAVSLTKLRN
jgi:hypothetical protein